jgi:hypothetical protein
MALGFLKWISKTAYQKARVKILSGRGTNRDRAAVEFYRFQTRKSAKPFIGYLKGMKITNWTGLRMCDIVNKKTHRSGFRNVTGRRSERTTFNAKCIDGRRYTGMSPGEGMYARLRPMKGR